jgi:hypothetical protein
LLSFLLGFIVFLHHFVFFYSPKTSVVAASIPSSFTFSDQKGGFTVKIDYFTSGTARGARKGGLLAARLCRNKEHHFLFFALTCMVPG